MKGLLFLRSATGVERFCFSARQRRVYGLAALSPRIQLAQCLGDPALAIGCRDTYRCYYS